MTPEKAGGRRHRSAGLRFARRTSGLCAAASLLAACASTRGASPGQHAESSPVQPGIAHATDSPVERPAGPLDRQQAERYILRLINHDRASQGLSPVAWDETAARAGQQHAEDMVRHGFTAHWGSDGSVPESRYTAVGGVHMVQENAGCFADGKPRELDPDPRFDPADIEKVESAFFEEAPPNDGHRRNILKAWHTHVGVGLTKALGSNVVCQAQEFLDRYGTYATLPSQAQIGAAIHVAGTVQPPAKFIGVGLARVDTPKPMSVDALTATSTYAIPAPYATYFPKGFKTPKPVRVRGRDFSIDLSLSDHGKRGLYEVSVWGQVPGSKDFVMLSLRTIRVP